jgi:4-oxalocrotonate tautomerase
VPLVRISFKRRQSREFAKGVSSCVHRGLVEALGVPEGDRFQIITEHTDDLVYDAHFLDIERTDDIVIIQITLASGRTVELKSALYKHVADLLAAEMSVRPQDVLINLVEVARENWSFGNGEAQYASAPPPHLANAAA